MTSTITVPSTDIVTEAKIADAFTAAKVDIAALQAGSTAVDSTVSAGTGLTLAAATHNGKTILLDLAAGSDIVLPTATGSGAKYRFLVTVASTGTDTHTFTCTAGTTFIGLVFGVRVDSGNAVLGWGPAAANNKMILNHAGTGGVTLGEWLEIEDVAVTVYSVSGQLSATGLAFATPFSTV